MASNLLGKIPSVDTPRLDMLRRHHVLPTLKKLLRPVLRPLWRARLREPFVKLVIINRYRRAFKRMPNLLNPQTFNEKLLLKILFDRNPRLTLFADKFLVREFVASRLGDNRYLTTLYAVVDRPTEIGALTLPSQFVMKPNHLSGQIKIVHDATRLERGELERWATKWLSKNYYDEFNEWAYKHIRPRIMFEELLHVGGSVPDDYKFFCFHGEPRFLQIDRNRFTTHQRNIYDLQFTLLPVKLVYDNFHEPMRPPHNFDAMVEIARTLSAGSDFLRVDLYNVSGRIVFGELTNYPFTGLEQFQPPSWNRQFGSYWKRTIVPSGRS